MKTSRDGQIGAVTGDPGMHLAAVDAAGRAHVGNDAEKCSVLQQAESIHAGFAADHRISAALESGLHIGHDGRLIFDEQHGQRLRFEGG